MYYNTGKYIETLEYNNKIPVSVTSVYLTLERGYIDVWYRK